MLLDRADKPRNGGRKIVAVCVPHLVRCRKQHGKSVVVPLRQAASGTEVIYWVERQYSGASDARFQI